MFLGSQDQGWGIRASSHPSQRVGIGGGGHLRLATLPAGSV